MKTPQRKFVVEFKSGRRQTKARTNSIWGDADLKALVREVEDKAPHLLNSNGAPGAPDEGGDMSSDLMNSGCASEQRVRAVVRASSRLSCCALLAARKLARNCPSILRATRQYAAQGKTSIKLLPTPAVRLHKTVIEPRHSFIDFRYRYSKGFRRRTGLIAYSSF